MITYIKNTELLRITVPYDLKDLFKRSFKTAKWNSNYKVWEITNNTRNENKLNQFINGTALLASEMETIKAEEQEAEFTENELSDLEKEVTQLRSKINSTRKNIESLKEINESILSARETVKELKEELNSLETERKNEKAKVEEFVDSLIDTNKLGRISSLIASKARKSFLYATEKDDLRAELAYADEAKEILERAGFESNNLNKLAGTRINRLDRDNFNLSSEDFYDIQAI